MDFLIVDDDKTFRDAASLLIENEGHLVEAAPTGQTALLRLREDTFDVVLLDLRLGNENGLDVLVEILKQDSLMPVVVLSADGTIGVAVEAMRRGAIDFLEKPFRREQFHALLARVQRIRQLGKRIESLEREVTEKAAQHVEPIFDFTVPAMREVMDVLMRAAPTPASLLILGESGTGKSVAVRAVHANSHLADKPLVTVSCPSLSKELLESELFGHVKGSFTGAVKDRWGKVKSAEGGTLFLDEVGDLPLEIQPKLLRLLQEREYERLGENTTRHADVRVIAATNRDLKKRVADGSFRDDLYFRLNVISVEMPPLRCRQGDLIRIAEHYLHHFAAQCNRTVSGFSEDAIERMLGHSWPGNLRELRNAIERAVILAKGQQVTAYDLPAQAVGASEAVPANRMLEIGSKVSLEQLEEAHLRRVLSESRSLVEAAEILGIDQATLYRKRKRLGLG